MTSTLPLLREQILTCDVCFAHPDPCRHHEDALGGYERHGKVLFLGLNPQASADDSVYATVRRLSWSQKATLGDELLNSWATGTSPSVLTEDDWARHKGRQWLNMACDSLVGEPSDPRVRRMMADRFVIVDAYKHATRDLGELEREIRSRPALRFCPTKWVTAQIDAARPRMIVVSGNAGLKVSRNLFRWPEGSSSTVKRERIGALAGRVFLVETRSGYTLPALMTVAISRRTRGWWERHKVQMRAVIARTSGLA